MVLSVKSAAGAGYYFQPWGRAETPASASGVWMKAPAGLGLEAQGKILALRRRKPPEVAITDLHRLLHRMTADGGETPIFNRKQKSSGYDFVFSAPKSVSVIWALSSAAWRRAIESAHEAAVESAIEVLAVRAIAERVGKGGQKLRPAEAAMAAFFHYRCRPAYHKEFEGPDAFFADPNLHTHVVVPDIVVSSAAPTERRLKIAYTALYGRWSMALGAWYHARLAFELRRLGLEIVKVAPSDPSWLKTNGLFQVKVKGVSSSLVFAFSARTQGAIDLRRAMDFPEALHIDKEKDREKLARNDRAKRERGLAETKSKALNGDFEADEERWVALAKKHAVSTPVLAGEPEHDGRFVSSARRPFFEAWSDIIDKLTEDQAVLQRPDCVRGIAARLVADGALLEPTSKMVDAFVEHEELIRLPPSASYLFPQWTSKTNLRDEEQVVALAERLLALSFTRAQPRRRAPGTLDWTDDQWRAIRKLAGSDRLVVLTGVPGSGKTSLLKPVVSAYQAQHPNMKIIAAAEAWKTALSLRDITGGEIYALAALFEKERHGRLELNANCLLIVDEVGLLSTKRMLQLLRMVERTGGKLILVGDSAQLSPIGAGSGLDLIKKALSPIELDEIKRQSTAPQRRLVDSLVAVANTSQDRGQAVAAQAAQSLAKTLQEGCAWTSHPRSKEAVQDVAERVAAEIDPNSVVPGRLVALARSHRETQYVSRLVRAILRKRGDLEGEDLPLKAITPTGLKYSLKIAKGDRVRFLTRLRKHEIFNGTQGVIDEINQEASIRVRLTEPSHGNTSRYVDIAISELHDDSPVIMRRPFSAVRAQPMMKLSSLRRVRCAFESFMSRSHGRGMKHGSSMSILSVRQSVLTI
jgi:conjugative relaxase-like TrwC/TraI family protein